jgi:hypothetical protein
MQLALRPRVAKRAPSPDPGSEEDDEDQPPTRRSRSSRPRSRRQRTSAREAPFEGEDEEGEADVEPRQLVQGTAWLAEEDHALRNAVETHGTSWKKIEYDLSRLGYHRSTAMCRNRYQRMCAPSQEGKEGRNRCKRCGQIKRGHTCTAETPVVTHRPARDAPMLISPALVPSRRRPGQGGAGKVDMGLPDLSIIPPAAGNDFKVDLDGLASCFHGVPPEKNDSFLDSLNLDSLSASFSFGGALDEATPVPTKTASNDSSTYLTSAAPPPIAPKTLHTSRLPLPFDEDVEGSLVTTTFDEEYVEHGLYEYVELSNLHQAAEDALKSRSVASFGATPQRTTRVADAAPVGGSREEDETPTLPAEGEEEEKKIDADSYRTALNEEEKKHAETERLLRTPPPGLTEHPFDEPLRAETPTSTPIGAPVILPVFSTPSMHTSYGAPPLVPLPSWSRGPPSFSRAPSFSFADNNQAPYLAVPPVPPSRSTGSA